MWNAKTNTIMVAGEKNIIRLYINVDAKESKHIIKMRILYLFEVGRMEREKSGCEP